MKASVAQAIRAGRSVPVADQQSTPNRINRKPLFIETGQGQFLLNICRSCKEFEKGGRYGRCALTVGCGCSLITIIRNQDFPKDSRCLHHLAEATRGVHDSTKVMAGQRVGGDGDR